MPALPDSDSLLRTLRTKGIEDAEAYFSSASTLSIEYAGNTYKSKEFSEDAGMGVRILRNRRLGFSHSNIPANFTNAAEAAEKLSRISPRTDFSFEPPRKCPRPKTTDPRLRGLPAKIAFNAVEEILEGIREHAEPTKVSISLSEGDEKLANTESLSARSEYTSVSIYAEAKKGRGLGYSIYSSRSLPKTFVQFGTEAGKIASGMSESAPIPTQKLTVKFSPYTLSSLLRFLMFSLDGDNKRRGITRLKKGQKKFSSSFTLISDPLAPADSACPFDGDGVPSAPTTLIKNGKVQDFLYDKYTAALEGVEKKGSCQRTDYASFPSPGITNLTIPRGKARQEKPGKYLEVVSFHGLHTSDPVSGDFGVDVDIGFLHEKGKSVPVTDVLLTGNIFNLFNSIKYLGRTLSVHGNIVSPEIWFSNVHIVGK